MKPGNYQPRRSKDRSRFNQPAGSPHIRRRVGAQVSSCAAREVRELAVANDFLPRKLKPWIGR